MTMRATFRVFAVALLLCFICRSMPAQTPAKPADPRGESVDRIIAIVNGQIILQSDLDEEVRFAKLQPYRLGAGKTLREQAMSRLIDRTLILQQQQGMGQAPITDAELDAAITDLRKDLPACAHAACETDEGWIKFLAGVGFTPEEVRERWRIRLEVLRFIEQRFRAGIRISDAQIEEFYKTTMLPQYAQQKVQPPPLETISARIEQVLLEQQVSVLLDQWLKTLREQGSVRILKEGEDAQ
ncbi:peptidylprolyl isomerase [Terriglobus saanensis]|uniref:SurA domain protein n=1 Tax=Terriglobus saanensis (strain ATCC BAA-1853 / DSM 23119 / SP1PR4) TaxID=401053 RepID=E8UXP8_TERSS|nr:peptidylprolyl isomerase [Terriglobus saanensis]ADV81992.1 SurA domain protein [Terriglobus saanensis SP1PR4]